MARSRRRISRGALGLLLALGLLAPQVAEAMGALVAGNTRVTYAGANAACMLMGGQLVVVDSDAKNAAVVAAKATEGMAELGCWLGRDRSTGYMRNGFAHDFSYDGTEHCLHMQADGAWEDAECGFTMGYVCEMPMPPPSPPPPFPPNLHPRPPPPTPPMRPPPSPAPTAPPEGGITEDGIQMLIVIAAVCGFCCLCCGYCALQRRRASSKVDAEKEESADKRAAAREERRNSQALA